MIKHSLVFAVAVSIALVGCQTYLDVRPDGSGYYSDSPKEARIGLEYGLPMLQFKLDVNRMLTRCVDKEGNVDIGFLAKVSAEPHYVVGERYVVHYPRLSGWSKTTKFELQTYENGALKSINTVSEDQSAAIIGSIVKTGIGIMSLSSGVPLPIQKTNKPSYYCSDKTMTLLQEVKDSKADLEAKTKILVDLTDELTRLARVASMNAMTEAAKHRFEEVQIQILAETKRVASAQEALSKFADRVSVSEQLIWPLSVSGGAEEYSQFFTPNSKNKQKLMDLFVQKEEQPPGFTADQIDHSMALYLRLEAVVRSNDQVKNTELKVEDLKSKGLMYRSPVPARLLACQVSKPEDCTVMGASSVVINDNVIAPQLGALRVLPMLNGVFENNVLKITLRENGSVASFAYDENASQGSVLSEATAAVMTDLLAYRDARKAFKDKTLADVNEEASNKRKILLEELDAEVARLEKLNQIHELKTAAARNDELGGMQYETVQLNARIALLEARRKLLEANDALIEAGRPSQ